MIIFENIFPNRPIIFFNIKFLISIFFTNGSKKQGAKGAITKENDFTLNRAFEYSGIVEKGLIIFSYDL